MLKRLGLCLGPRKHRTREDKIHLRNSSIVNELVDELDSFDGKDAEGSAAGRDAAQKMGRESSGGDEPLLLTDIDIDDDFNLLEESPDGGRTYYSGGRDATGHRETVRWEGVGLIRTPRSKTNSKHTRSESMKEVISAPLLEKEMRCDSVTEVCRGSSANERIFVRQKSAPASYRELRAAKSRNRPPDVSKNNRQWHIARELELDMLRQQWVDYERNSRRGKKTTRKTWSKTQSTLELVHGREESTPEQQLQSTVCNGSYSVKQHKQNELPVVSPLLQDDAPVFTQQTSSGLVADAGATSPTPDALLEEALAVASRFSDGNDVIHRRAMSVGAFRDRIDSSGQGPSPQHREGGLGFCGSRTSGRLSPAAPNSAGLKTPRGGGAHRNSRLTARPPRNPADTPRASRNSITGKNAAGPPLRTAGKNKIPKLDEDKPRVSSAPQRVPLKRSTSKSRAQSTSGSTTPRGAFGGGDAGALRTAPLSTPRRAINAHKGGEHSSSDSKFRKVPLARAVPSPRPGFGPAVRVPLQKAPLSTPRKVFTPRDSDNYGISKAARLPLSSPQCLQTGVAKMPANKAVNGLPRGVANTARVK